MTENSFVVIFPSPFSKNKMKILMMNIKKNLQLRGQEFKSIKKDDDVILVNANDPVFASSVINNLFGIKQIAIARQVKNEFNSVVQEIVKIGGNLLLNGEKFFVKVEGHTSGFLPSDIEMAVTSLIIESKSKLGALPGSKEKYDKLLYTYLTKNYAYICIFTDKGHGGIPQDSQNNKLICAVYDELSAVSCLEAIKQGFSVKIIVIYRKKTELLTLVKILNQLLQVILEPKIKLEFFHMKTHSKDSRNYLIFLNSVTDLICHVAEQNKISWVATAISPLIFPNDFIENNINRITKNKMIPVIPLSGLDEDVFTTAKEFGLSKFLPKIEKMGKVRFPNVSLRSKSKISQQLLDTKKEIVINLGPNNLHEIMDSLDLEH